MHCLDMWDAKEIMEYTFTYLVHVVIWHDILEWIADQLSSPRSLREEPTWIWEQGANLNKHQLQFPFS